MCIILGIAMMQNNSKSVLIVVFIFVFTLITCDQRSDEKKIYDNDKVESHIVDMMTIRSSDPGNYTVAYQEAVWEDIQSFRNAAWNAVIAAGTEVPRSWGEWISGKERYTISTEEEYERVLILALERQVNKQIDVHVKRQLQWCGDEHIVHVGNIVKGLFGKKKNKFFSSRPGYYAEFSGNGLRKCIQEADAVLRSRQEDVKRKAILISKSSCPKK